MGLADDLASLGADSRRRPCRAVAIEAELPPDLAALYAAKRDDKGVKVYRLARAIAANGYSLSESTLDRHRDHSCCCYRGDGVAGV